LPGYALLTPQPFYNEFLIRGPLESKALRDALVVKRLLAGVPLAEGLLLAFTEQNTRAEIDQLVTALGEVAT
jgi:glycine cleavage system pyridoxal-binding protein P